MNIYHELTRKFNEGRLRAIISSGQACVLHGIAIMSKDGDWIIREDDETAGHILKVLESMGAKYRFGAPLDVRWLSGGWSSHLEFDLKGLRVRADFVTRPPRLSETQLKDIWEHSEGKELPFLEAVPLIEIKKTLREKDYVFIGELARLLPEVKDKSAYSRSAKDLIRIMERYSENQRDRIIEKLPVRAEILKLASVGDRDALETALDKERREMMHADEKRLERYMEASKKWLKVWLALEKTVKHLPLTKAHDIIVKEILALRLLPFKPEDPPAPSGQGIKHGR